MRSADPGPSNSGAEVLPALAGAYAGLPKPIEPAMHITLKALATFPDQLAAHFAAIPADRRHWAPSSWEGIPSEHLTAIEQVCHVRDIEIDGYQVRFRRALEENHPALPGIDAYSYARERRYHAADPDEMLSAFRSARARTVQVLGSLDPVQLDRTADFDGYGVVTVRGLIHFLASHDQQHLAGMQWLLGKIHAPAV